MTELQLSLTRLIGKKDLSFGCLIYQSISDGINHAPVEDSYYWWKDETKVWTFLHFEDTSTGEPWAITMDENGNHYESLMYEFDEECDTYWEDRIEIIGHPATLSDFHMWMDEQKIGFAQYNGEILCLSFETGKKGFDRFPYDSSKDLLSQSEETIKAIISLIQSYERN